MYNLHVCNSHSLKQMSLPQVTPFQVWTPPINGTCQAPVELLFKTYLKLFKTYNCYLKHIITLYQLVISPLLLQLQQLLTSYLYNITMK